MEKLTNTFRLAVAIARESILHPRSTSVLDEKGRVISRDPVKKAPKR